MGLEVVPDDYVVKKTSHPRLQNYVFYIVAVFTIFSPGLSHVFVKN